MVAREMSGSGYVRRLLDTWRSVLARVFSVLARTSRGLLALAASLARRLYDLRLAELLRPGSLPMALLASALVLSGQAVTVLLAPDGTLRAQALVTALLVLISLSVTLAVLVAESARTHHAEKPAVEAWFVGLLPWTLALSPIVWPACWLASAWVTRSVLVRTGRDRRWSTGRSCWRGASRESPGWQRGWSRPLRRS